MSELINVHLYGDGSRNSRLRAEYIYCDHANECSAYKKGKCFCVTTLLAARCGVGSVSVVDGGLKRSKAYARVQSEAKSNEQYGKLQYPSYECITRIGEKAFLTIPYIRIEEMQDGHIRCKDPGFDSNKILIDADRLTPENIKRICDYCPCTTMGGIIENYKDKAVPMFLHQLSLLFPERFSAFISAYPEFEVISPDWVGRYAKLSTCNRNEKYKDAHGNVFHFDGDYIVCPKYHLSFTPFGAKETEMRVKITGDMEVKITDNKQVLATTVFR